MLKRFIIMTMILLCTSGYVSVVQRECSKANAVKNLDRRDVQKFIWDMHLKHGFNAWDLTLVLKIQPNQNFGPFLAL